MADAGALKNWERHRTEREDRERALHEEAEATAEKLRAVRLEVGVKAGEKNRLFGSVTNREIADLLAKEGSRSTGTRSSSRSRSRRSASTV